MSLKRVNDIFQSEKGSITIARSHHVKYPMYDFIRDLDISTDYIYTTSDKKKGENNTHENF